MTISAFLPGEGMASWRQRKGKRFRPPERQADLVESTFFFFPAPSLLLSFALAVSTRRDDRGGLLRAGLLLACP